MWRKFNCCAGPVEVGTLERDCKKILPDDLVRFHKNMEELEQETRYDKLDRFADYSLHLMLPPYQGYYTLKDSGEV